MSSTYKSQVTYTEATYLLKDKLAWRMRHVYRLDQMPKSYIRVLLRIAMEGPKTKYQIEKETGLSHAMVHEAIKVLLDYGHVEGKRVGTTRVGLPKTEFLLSPRGLIEAVAVAEQNDVGRIAQRWQHTEPVFFGKWNYLVEKVGKEKTVTMLRRAASYLEWMTVGNNVERFRNEAVSQVLAEYQQRLSKSKDMSSLEKKELEKWIEAFEGDLELKCYFRNYIEEKMKFLKKEMEWIQFLKGLI